MKPAYTHTSSAKCSKGCSLPRFLSRARGRMTPIDTNTTR